MYFENIFSFLYHMKQGYIQFIVFFKNSILLLHSNINLLLLVYRRIVVVFIGC